MSLVSTARDSSSRSSRHNAATNAVLPDPTGPPTPTRSGSPAVRSRLGRWGCGSPSMKCGGMVILSRCEQGTLAFTVPLCEHIEQRVGQVGELFARQLGGLVAHRG